MPLMTNRIKILNSLTPWMWTKVINFQINRRRPTVFRMGPIYECDRAISRAATLQFQ